jgi:hypothetical protein
LVLATRVLSLATNRAKKEELMRSLEEPIATAEGDIKLLHQIVDRI